MAKKRPINEKKNTGLSVKIGRIKMKNPVMVASGTFGYGKEYKDLVDLKKLGAIVTKTITKEPRSGNTPPRIIETPSGMLNSIGLENDGVDAFIKNKLPYLRKIGIPVIVSIGGEHIKDFVRIARKLDKAGGIAGIEINISCPNLAKRRGRIRKTKRLFAQDKKMTSKVVKAVRKATSLTLITKLTPNVTDISKIAIAAQDAGSDAISLVNTYLGMAVDVDSKTPLLGNVAGGLSGPAIKPIALKAVWDVYNSVDISIIGMGGIQDAGDALEFMLCGASAIALGTTNFVYPNKSIEIISALGYYIKSNKIKKITSLTGSLKV